MLLQRSLCEISRERLLGALSVLNPLAGILASAENATHEAVKGAYRAAGRGIKSLVAVITVVTVAIVPKPPWPGGKPPSAKSNMQQVFELDTDHFQFFMGDRSRGPYVDTTHLWDTGESVATLPNEPFLIGIATARYGSKTRIVVEVRDGRPDISNGDRQKVGNFSLQILSGSLVLWAPESVDLSGLPTVPVQAGAYDGLVFSTGTEDVDDEMAADGSDEYWIVLWMREV